MSDINCPMLLRITNGFPMLHCSRSSANWSAGASSQNRLLVVERDGDEVADDVRVYGTLVRGHVLGRRYHLDGVLRRLPCPHVRDRVLALPVLGALDAHGIGQHLGIGLGGGFVVVAEHVVDEHHAVSVCRSASARRVFQSLIWRM